MYIGIQNIYVHSINLRRLFRLLKDKKTKK